MSALWELGDPGRIPIYMAASAMALVLVIVLAGSIGRGPPPSWLGAAVAAIAISLLGIVFAKYGAQFGLPWQVYYAVPMLATVVVPPIAFHFGFWRTCAYVVMALAAAPLLHAVFFYALGWEDYMPFLHLPRFPR
jgi:hypothetical protein